MLRRLWRSPQRGAPPGGAGLFPISRVLESLEAPGSVGQDLHRGGRALEAQRPPRGTDAVLERVALEELHRVPRPPAGDTLRHDAHDARMAQAPERVDLASDARDRHLGRGADGLDRGRLARLLVLAPVNDAHTTAAEHAEDAVRPHAPVRT